MQLSFIILNYKSEKYLKKCLISIIEKTKKISYEIIIVNNDEKKLDDLKRKFGNFLEFSGKIKIIEINKNVGFSRANNIGAGESSGEYICFINPDAEIVSENIREILKEFEIDKELGIIGPRVFKDNETQPWSVGVDVTIGEILRGKMGIARSKNLWNSSQKIEADWVSGVCMFVRQSVFKEMNGFDENFFLYYEDVDLCKRVKNSKRKIIYFPLFEIMHLEGKSSVNKYVQKLQYFKSQDYYYKKWFGPFGLFALKLCRSFYRMIIGFRHSRYLFRERS